MTKLIRKLPNLANGFHHDEFLTPFDSIFDSVMQTVHPSFTQDFGVDFFGKGAYPKVDVLDYEDRIEIMAEIAGLDKKDVSIEVEEDVLTIAGSKRSNSSEDVATRNFIKKELKHSSFRRSFRLSENFDTEQINAEFKNGILTIGIPKVEPEAPSKKFVEIK